ncbi:hypothetical protein MXL22_00500 [Staphylococcus pseudoxylosus]|uniref:hypothetical protein n=1 Tax=Staphylococcus pseudoxylosus TaxID=2282419 RepID=UPI002DB88875|nr:hypothetical protein [Staphylococcus pseudoxylosus]MEB6059562.1 hypothetical protein [Staphylococcus pseudoxylosus]
MITRQFIKQNLECSDVYAQKLIEQAQGDEEVLYNLFIQKRIERQNTQAIREVK